MAGKVDLHTHTTYSDGVLTPYELVTKAKEAGIEILSIADHDNVAALDEAIALGTQIGIEVITGVELSAAVGDRDIHILGYFFDHNNPTLLDYLALFRKERLKRAERIVEKLHHLRVPLSMDAVLDKAGDGSVGRPHIANALLDRGLTDSYLEAFEKYIGYGCPAYEKKFQLSPEEAVNIISSAGGISFLAHPGKYTSEAVLMQLIKGGVDGIEVVHPSHSPELQQYYRSVASHYYLLESGGSDFHGGKKNDDWALGTVTVSAALVDAMKRRLFA
jgi:predicted metal-dependent phosphoesterase TrpH